MKSKKRINLQGDVSDVTACIGLFSLLEVWIPSAEKEHNDMSLILEEDCCLECSSRKDDCYCYDERDGRYDMYNDEADYEDR